MRSLGKDIDNMKQSIKISQLKDVHSTAEKLQRAIDTHSYLLTPTCDTIGLSTTSSGNLDDLPSLSAELDSNGSKRSLNKQDTHGVDLVRKQQSRRQHSWPLREMDVFDDGRCVAIEFLPRMRKLESTAAMSLANFTSLLIEFVARLDYLVETVDELSRMAKFNEEH
ncbi:hypothetical protein IC582_022425 [Cucumis melo]